MTKTPQNGCQLHSVRDPYAAEGEPATLFRTVAALPGTPPEPKPSASRRTYPSGLTSFYGQTDEPQQLVQYLGRFMPLHLLLKPLVGSGPDVDADQQLLAGLKSENFLWTWFGGESQRQLSPRLLSPQELSDVSGLPAWGQDRLVCLYSSLNISELLTRLVAPDPADPPQRVLTLAQSGTTRAVLRAASNHVAETLMPEIDGILVEDDDPAGWECFCKAELAETLASQLELKN